MQLEGVIHCTFSCIALLAAQSRHSCQASRIHLSAYHRRVLSAFRPGSVGVVHNVPDSAAHL